MTRSMTGFGRAEVKRPDGLIRVEIKTTNQKFLEISAKFPPHLLEYEEEIRKIISQNIRRGKVNLFITAPDPSLGKTKVVLNEVFAREMAFEIKKLMRMLKMNLHKNESDRFIASQILRNPDAFVKSSTSQKVDAMQKDLYRCVRAALENLNTSRLFEGKALAQDFSRRLLEIGNSLKIIEKRIPKVIQDYKLNLEKRMKEFIKDDQIDKERITLEAAQYAKNSDISEEVTRMRSHLEAMKKTLKEAGELGRKIDFIGQEMYREANTMGAKSSDTAISAAVIQIKSSIEKIREQSQNVE